MTAREPRLAGWGRIFAPGREFASEDLRAITRTVPLTRGLGRSYGDSSLPPPDRIVVAGSRLADRLLAFDPENGALRVEAGVALDVLNRLFLPRGWFVPVSPGTSHVTVGGMVAADVHGKNHHVAGCFGAHVTELLMRVADGRIVRCSPEHESELFNATIGGMGLTGHILEVAFGMQKIPSPWIEQQTERFSDLDSFVVGLKAASAAFPMTMGWVDCVSKGGAMGRGILFRGRWAAANKAPPTPPRWRRPIPAPFEPPSWLLNSLTMRLFNLAIYHSHGARQKTAIVTPEVFWYPLDYFSRWNILYGPAGFTQHQCVLPDSAGTDAVRRFLQVISGLGGASFLCVIKDCGPEGQGLLSFPKPGISVALDIPVRPGTPALIDALNEAVIAEGGRIYLAKDRFTRPEHFAAMEPRLPAFNAIRDAWDPTRRLRSAQSVRLLGDSRGGPTDDPTACPPPGEPTS